VIIVDIWTFITIKLIGGMFKLAWSLVKTAWWLVVLLITSVALMVRSHDQPDQIPYAGDFIGNGEGLRWRDAATGTLYKVDEDTTMHCEVQASERTGMDMRMTALNRLMRGPAIMTNRFTAVVAGTGQVAAVADFPQECYRGIGLDHVDPAQAAQDQCDLRLNREQATRALDRLDKILFARGWTPDPDGDGAAHWYSRRYGRRAILRNSAIEAPMPAIAPEQASVP
jgi:hypothetical protein